MIIDESDERMFKDLESFYAGTKSDKVFTICLTATAYDGKDDGLHKKALNELGYQVYTYSDKPEDFNPIVHEAFEIGSLEKYRTIILKESEKCGVLIYATGTEYKSLC
jgi:hypothetical protein